MASTWTNIRHGIEDTVDEDTECELCYNDSMIEPLDWKSFSIETEWCKVVPLSMQLMICSFLNTRIINRTKDVATYMERKLVRLYSTFDNLLNLYNWKHSGVIKKFNSTELMANYKSITHMFRVGQEMGITTGYKTSQRKWNRSREDAYYNYSVKKFPWLTTVPSKRGSAT